MKELIFASQNAHKIEELKKILGNKFQILSLKDIGILEDIPETGTTLTENALIKAQYVFDKTGKITLSDDSGLEVESLNNAPGVYSARYAGEPKNDANNINLLLQNLAEKQNRNARFVTVLALIENENTQHVFEGFVEGKIITNRKGNNGFGYDPVFVPNGYEKTFAELSPEIKNSISHRANATKKLMEYLKNL